MRSIVFIVLLVICLDAKAQLNCSIISTTGTAYHATAFKHGKGKLLPTDTAITNHIQQRTFELKTVNALTESEKNELIKYKIKLNESDTVMFYDWDIIHNGKIGYFGKAVAKVRILCGDSMIYTQKYLLKEAETKYVPNQFKIIRMNQNDFILNDRIHPYMNINYYFKK